MREENDPEVGRLLYANELDFADTLWVGSRVDQLMLIQAGATGAEAISRRWCQPLEAFAAPKP